MNKSLFLILFLAISIAFLIGYSSLSLLSEKLSKTETFATTYYFDGSTLIARKDPDGKNFFYHPDHLGSTTLVTDGNGGVVEDTNYKPFGEVLYDGKSKFLYTGKEKDSESGLYYYGARYYNPGVGRFIQPDSLIPYIFVPQLLNRYSYTINNPYKFKDDSGHVLIYPVGIQSTTEYAGTGQQIGYNSEYFNREVQNQLIVVSASIIIGYATYGIGFTYLIESGIAADRATYAATAVSGVASDQTAIVTNNINQGKLVSEGTLIPSEMAASFVKGGAWGWLENKFGIKGISELGTILEEVIRGKTESSQDQKDSKNKDEFSKKELTKNNIDYKLNWNQGRSYVSNNKITSGNYVDNSKATVSKSGGASNGKGSYHGTFNPYGYYEYGK